MNIRDFGASGDGVHDDHAAIQAVLDNHDGLVTIPQGIYKIGATLRIRSDTHLKAHPAAHLFFADGAGKNSQSFLLTNQHHEKGDRNIHIEGGVWDGNNLNNLRGPDKAGSYTGALLNFIKVKDFSLRNLTVRDAEAYFIRLGEVSNFTVTGIRFEAPNQRPNQDGVHLGGYCEAGVIRDLVGVNGATNDDLVALNADDALCRAQNLDLKCGPIRNIRVENLKADSCHSFVRLLSVRSPISNIHIENIEGGCRCMALNLDGCRECRVKLFDPADPQYRDGVGDTRHIKISDLRVHKSDPDDNSPLINLRTNVQDFWVADFYRDMQKDLNPEASTILLSDCGVSQLSLAGITDKQVETLQKSAGIQSEIVKLALKEERFSGQCNIDRGGVFQLTRGGFSALAINEEPRRKQQRVS